MVITFIELGHMVDATALVPPGTDASMGVSTTDVFLVDDYRFRKKLFARDDIPHCHIAKFTCTAAASVFEATHKNI